MAIDSFFINGAVPSALILSTLGITEGQRIAAYTEEFFRPNECRPLAKITFTDSTFSTPSSATTLAENFNTDLSTGVKSISANADFSIYPNPVTNNTFTINIPGAQVGNWSYQLFSTTGAEITSGKLSLGSGQNSTQVSISDKLTSGIYYIALNHNGEFMAVKTLNIMK